MRGDFRMIDLEEALEKLVTDFSRNGMPLEGIAHAFEIQLYALNETIQSGEN